MFYTRHTLLRLGALSLLVALGGAARPAGAQTTLILSGTYALTSYQNPDLPDGSGFQEIGTFASSDATLGLDTASFADTLLYTDSDFYSPIIDGRVTFTGSDGDQLFATYIGTNLASRDFSSVSDYDVLTFTGGTGAFSGAAGQGSLVETQVYDPNTQSYGAPTILADGVITPAAAPEPGPLAVLGTGAVLLGVVARWRQGAAGV